MSKRHPDPAPYAHGVGDESSALHADPPLTDAEDNVREPMLLSDQQIGDILEYWRSWPEPYHHMAFLDAVKTIRAARAEAKALREERDALVEAADLWLLRTEEYECAAAQFRKALARTKETTP